MNELQDLLKSGKLHETRFSLRELHGALNLYISKSPHLFVCKSKKATFVLQVKR